MDTADIQETLLQQIQNYLDGFISKEDYAILAEEYFSAYGNHITCRPDFPPCHCHGRVEKTKTIIDATGM